MPEVLDPPKKSFSANLAANLPSSAQNPAPPEPLQPKPADAPSSPPTGKPASIAAPPADADVEILEGKRAPKGDDFKRVKHAAAEANKRADELEARHKAAEKELVELRKTPKHNAELIKQIESERDELKAKWQTVAAQFDAGFHAKYDSRVGEAVARIKDALPVDRFEDISQVLRMPEGERKRKILAELTEDLDQIAVTDVMLANREVRDILAARKKELEDSSAILKAGAEQRRKEQDERRAAYTKSFEAVLDAKSKGDGAIPVLQTREGDAPEVKAWNDGVAERSRVARAVFMDEFESPEEKAEAAIWAASAPGFLAELKAAQLRVAELEGELKKVQGASPGIGARAGGSAGTEKKTFSQRMAEVAIH